MEQDGLGQACQQLWYVHRDDLRNHLREADLGGQRLGLDVEVEGELMELPHHLEQGEQRENMHRYIINPPPTRLCLDVR